MAWPRQTRKQGSTEPEEFILSATGLVDLSDLTNAHLYMRESDATVNKVDGALLTVTDSGNRIVEFDPSGAAVGGGDAFEDTGAFLIYIRATWSDGDITRHPDDGYIVFQIQENFE